MAGFVLAFVLTFSVSAEDREVVGPSLQPAVPCHAWSGDTIMRSTIRSLVIFQTMLSTARDNGPE